MQPEGPGEQCPLHHPAHPSASGQANALPSPHSNSTEKLQLHHRHQTVSPPTRCAYCSGDARGTLPPTRKGHHVQESWVPVPSAQSQNFQSLHLPSRAADKRTEHGRNTPKMQIPRSRFFAPPPPAAPSGIMLKRFIIIGGLISVSPKLLQATHQGLRCHHENPFPSLVSRPPASGTLCARRVCAQGV